MTLKTLPTKPTKNKKYTIKRRGRLITFTSPGKNGFKYQITNIKKIKGGKTK